MKGIVALCVFMSVGLAVARPGDDKYTDRYDNVDLDEILNNKKLLEPHIKCILDQGKCSPDAKEVKDHIVEALETDCSKCNDVQKKGVQKVLTHLINHEPDYWNDIIAKYDPTKKYITKYEKELKEAKA